MRETIHDLIVIGGGINGVGIAVDAQGRGLKTVLLEKDDLAQATSSASSKLIHGGLRYLEHYEFRLVREALTEREVLLHKAPHIIRPLRFQLPHRPHLRPAWMIRAGLFLYDQLGRRDVLPGSRHVRYNPADSILKPEITQGYEYSDCWVDDARLVVLNAMQLTEKGGAVLTRHECLGAEVRDGLWVVRVRDRVHGEEFELRSRGLVNAAGPWVKTLLTEALKRPSPHGIRLIKGSHIVVPRIPGAEQAFILQNSDGRIVFVIPYLNDFSIVGTTDVEHRGAPETAQISDEEIEYLCGVVNAHFKQEISRQQIVWTWSGVRPLCDDESSDPKAITRDYTLELELVDGLPLLSVFGGKLTTYRRLAESAMKQLRPHFPTMGPSWTAQAILPGGDFGHGGQPLAYADTLQQKYPFLEPRQAQRLAVAYGSRCEVFLRESTVHGQGARFGADLFAAEVDYLRQHEFALTTDDILWRRSKLGLALTPLEVAALADYLGTTNDTHSTENRHDCSSRTCH